MQPSVQRSSIFGPRQGAGARATLMLDGSAEAERRRLPSIPAGARPRPAPTGRPGTHVDLVPLILRNKENKHRFMLESVERSLRDIAVEQQIEKANIRIGYESQPEGPFNIKVSGELATELLEAGKIDIFEMKGKEEDHFMVEFEVHRADGMGRNVTLFEELQAKSTRHESLAQARREERAERRESKAPSTLATVMWPFELLGYEEDKGTVDDVVEQIHSAMQMCQKGPEGSKLFTYNVVPTTKTPLGAPDNKSLVYIDFIEGVGDKEDGIVAGIEWPRAIAVPGVTMPLKFAFKRDFCQKHGLKTCCNRTACARTTQKGVCKVHYAFRPPDLEIAKLGVRLSSFNSERHERDAAKLDRKRKREAQVAQRSELHSAAKAVLAAKKECRWHPAGRCAKVLSGCPCDHKGIDPSEIDCASTRPGGKCKIGEGCPYRGHKD